MTPRPRCRGALLRDPAKSWAQTDPCGPCGPKGLEEVITGEELRLKEPNGSRRVPRDEPCDMGPWPRARLITPGGGRTPASSTPQERSSGRHPKGGRGWVKRTDHAPFKLEPKWPRRGSDPCAMTALVLKLSLAHGRGRLYFVRSSPDAEIRHPPQISHQGG